MKISVLIFIGLSLAVNMAHAEPMAGPESNWTNYDLLAKVEIRAIDLSRDVVFSESPLLKAYGHPLTVRVIDSMRAPGTNMEYIVLAPAYGIKKGERISFRNYEEGAFAASNVITIGCLYLSNKDWLVIKDVLPEEMWLKYTNQKNLGTSDDPIPSFQAEMERQEYEQEEAAKKIEHIIGQKRRGEISEEEFRSLTLALEEILHKPIILPSLE